MNKVEHLDSEFTITQFFTPSSTCVQAKDQNGVTVEQAQFYGLNQIVNAEHYFSILLIRYS